MKILAVELKITGAASDDFQSMAGDEARRVWELIRKKKFRVILSHEKRTKRGDPA